MFTKNVKTYAIASALLMGLGFMPEVHGMKRKRTEEERPKSPVLSEATKNLLLGAKTGDMYEVTSSLRLNADIEGCLGKNTALRLACDGGHVEVIAHLLSWGASKESIGAYGWTILQSVCASQVPNQLKILKLLFDAHVNLDALSSDQQSAVYIASKRRHHEIVGLLVSKGALVVPEDVNIKGSLNLTKELFQAVLFWDLVGKGQRVNQFDYQGPVEAIRKATSNDPEFVMALILRPGLAFHIFSALPHEVRHAVLKVIFSFITKQNDNPFDHEQIMGMARYLIQQNVLFSFWWEEFAKLAGDVQQNLIQGCDLRGPLCTACTNGNLAIVDYLWRQGACLHGDIKFDPLRSAAQALNHQVVAFLLSKGAVTFNQITYPLIPNEDDLENLERLQKITRMVYAAKLWNQTLQGNNLTENDKSFIDNLVLFNPEDLLPALFKALLLEPRNALKLFCSLVKDAKGQKNVIKAFFSETTPLCCRHETHFDMEDMLALTTNVVRETNRHPIIISGLNKYTSPPFISVVAQRVFPRSGQVI